jgi:hypothetical protein
MWRNQIMLDNQWKLDMTDGIVAASQAGVINKVEVGALHASIKEPINHQQMDADTRQRTKGKCPTAQGYLHRQYGALAEVIRKTFRSDQGLNQKREVRDV